MRKLIYISLVIGAFSFAYKNMGNKEKAKKETYSMTIAEITSDTRLYDNKVVSIEGLVESSANLLFLRGYTLNDSTGTILVLTDKSVPNEGEFVKVTGVFNQRLKIGNRTVSTITEQ